MATPEASRIPLVSLSDFPATPQQRRVAFAVAAGLLLAFAISAPFANIQLPRYDGYIPAIESMVFVNDLITAILLFAHYSISPSRPVLALASAYLYTALIVIPHILTFPGAFTATGLLGAGPQTSAWLYYLWSAGPPVGAIIYACLRGENRTYSAHVHSTRSAIAWSIALVVCLALAITWITTAENKILSDHRRRRRPLRQRGGLRREPSRRCNHGNCVNPALDTQAVGSRLLADARGLCVDVAAHLRRVPRKRPLYARLLRFARLYPRHVHSCAGSVAERDDRSLCPPSTLKRAAQRERANKLLNLRSFWPRSFMKYRNLSARYR